MPDLPPGYTIETDPSKLDFAVIHGFLATSYWASERSRGENETAWRNSYRVFGVYLANQQVGGARVISDGVTFGWLADVFVVEEHRGRGLGKALVETIIADPELGSLIRFVLGTRDAHGLYAQYGWQPLTFADRWMIRMNGNDPCQPSNRP